MENKIKKIKKRNKEIVDFDLSKIEEAIHKAITATGQGDGAESKRVSEKVVDILNRRFRGEEIPSVEQVQDIVEEALILEGLADTAKAYILYREQRRRIREAASSLDESTERIDKYIKELDWQVYENANMTFSLQGLNQYAIADVSKKYWLNKIYPKEIRDAGFAEDIHIHDLESISTYCCGWDLYDLLKRGFGGVPGKLECKPPKHLRTALGQLVNFFYTLQGESAGAQAVSNFDTLLAPYIRYDNLTYPQVKQAMQEFLFNCMVPTRVGFQTPFLNISLDVRPPSFLAKQPVLIGGEVKEETYGEFQEEINMLLKAFYEGIMEGDAKGRPFTFPIPTVSITKDFDWENPALERMWEATAKYGINYFSNFVQSDMNPDDFRSMCILPEETILIKEEGSIKKMSMEELFLQYKKEKIDNEWFKVKGNIEALSLNPETGKVEWSKINKFLEANDNEIVNIKTRDGKLMRVTKDHLVAVFTEDGIKTKKAKEINENDFLLVLKDASNALEKEKLDSDLAWFMGLFVADGNYLYDTRYKNKKRLRGIQISFNYKEKELIERTKKVVKKLLGYEMKFTLDKRYENSLRGYIYNSEFAKHLYEGMDLQKYNRLPEWIWSVDHDTIKSFLDGFFAGDGYEKGNEIHINDKSLAKELNLLFQLTGISTTYIERSNSQVIRIQHTLGRNSFGDRIIKDKLHNLVPEFLLEKKVIKGGNNRNIYQSYGCTMVGLTTIDRWNLTNPLIEWVRSSDFAVVGVKDIHREKLNYNQVFYDIELEKNHYFVHSDGNITHNCCRLRLDNKELYMRGGGLFGSQPLTGSVGVVTINLPRIGYLSKTKNEFFERLTKMMDLAKESLEIKRKALDNFMEKGLYPYSKHYLDSVKKIRGSHFGNHFSTIGLMGMNEALLNFLNEDMGSKRGKKFALEVMDFMRDRLVKYQEETGWLYNLEATPGEGTSYRQARADKERYPDIITAGTEEAPYYTNSSQLPVNYTDDVFEAVKLQDDVQCKYTGGTVLHVFLGEKIKDPETAKLLVKKIFNKFHLPYITLTPTFSICPTHGYLSGENFECPKCTIKQPCEVYSRIVGYIRPVQQWNKGKEQEYKERKEFKDK